MSTPAVQQFHRPDLDRRAEELYRREAASYRVPAHLIDELVRYLVHHIQPAEPFLSTVLSGEHATQPGFSEVYGFLWRVAPQRCWGNRTTVEAWVAERAR
jgi:hypothetical protein